MGMKKKTEVKLIYNVVLVFGEQKSDSYIYIYVYIYMHVHMCIYICTHIFFSIMVYYRILSITPCVIQQDFVVCFIYSSLYLLGFSGGSDSKESACNAGDLGSIRGLGRSPEGGNGNPLQCSCLENSTDRGAWWATVHGVA